MRVNPAVLACALLTACPQVDDVPTLSGNEGGTGRQSGDAGTPTSDAGAVPCVPAPDADGGAGPGLVVSEIFPAAEGFFELLLRSGPALAAGEVEVSIAGATGHPPADLVPGSHLAVGVVGLATSGELVVRAAGRVLAYACWGSVVPSVAQNEAVVAGAWQSAGACALSPPPGLSLHATGTGRFAAEFTAGPPSPPTCQ